MKTLVIIPAYNESSNILNVINNLNEYFNNYDYIVINDCSTDNTEIILNTNHICHITLPVNLGLAGAVQTGYKYAWENGYDCAIQFDGDGQHEAVYISSMIDEIKKGADIVIGSRFVNKRKDLSLRMLGSRVLTMLISVTTGKRINDPTSGMRMLNRKMIYDFAYNMNRRPEPDTIVYELRKGAKIVEVQVEMKDRVAGVSLYSGLGNSVKYMVKMIISILFLSY